MRTSGASSPTLGQPTRERPQLLHVVAGVAIAAFSYYFLSQFFQAFLIGFLPQFFPLKLVSFDSTLGKDNLLLVARLLNGSGLDVAITWQRSGLFSIVIFGLLFVFLAFPLRGSLLLKVFWLEVGNAVGLMWGFIRLSTFILVAYNYGPNFSTLVEFIMGPISDFLWIVPIWSLGLSTLIFVNRRSNDRKR